MAEQQLVHLDIDGIFAIITLNNPAKFNSLTQSSYYRLASLLREADENEDVYVTVLIGEGRFFSAYVGHLSSLPREETDVKIQGS